ncbi:MAG: right-handed parallel beta-helix repeat-containing protein [Candidatus Heimdallarchaeota archaeon]
MRSRNFSYFILAILCFSLYFQIADTNIGLCTTYTPQPLITSPLVAKDSDSPIYISNETGFIVLGCPGDGTDENPYRIENKSFVYDGYTPRIKVFNTTSHFIIQNCYFETLKFGIDINFVAANTSIIRNNVFHNISRIPISIYRSNYTRIENNSIRNTLEGIYVYNSCYTSIVNNSLFGCYDYEGIMDPSGIHLYRSHYGSIINNTINNFQQGIHTYQCSGFLIENNTCLYCRYSGSIYIRYSFNMLIKRNYIYHNLQDSGIFLEYTDNCTIFYNTIHDCPVFGVALVLSDNNMVYRNNFVNATILLLNNQAFDNGINNTWYLTDSEEGNYWYDWSGTGSYEIDGSVPGYNYDHYPLYDLYGIEFEDLYFPNTINDDSYEENDYSFNNPKIALSTIHSLHYADVDFFRISLTTSCKYSFELDFNYTSTNLDFYLLEEEYYEAIFHPLNSSRSKNSNEKFTFIAPSSGEYYLLIIGDIAYYRDIIPTDYTLAIFPLAYIPPTSTLVSISMLNWFIALLTIPIITISKRIYNKFLKSFLKIRKK